MDHKIPTLISPEKSKEKIQKSSSELITVTEEKKKYKERNNLVTKLLKEVNESQKYFDTLPKIAEEYVEFKKALDKCTKRLEELDNHLNYLRDLYDLADEFHVPIPDEVMNDYYNFSDALTVLQSSVERLNSDIRNEVNEPWLTDAQSNSHEVKVFLKDLNERLINCHEKSNLYKSYQKFFRVEVTKFDLLEEASEAVRLRILLWDSLDEWDKNIQCWEEDNFQNLDVEKVNAFLALNLKYLMQFKKGLSDCELINTLKEKVYSFKDIMPTIITLRNPDLRVQHWHKIEQLLGVKFPQNEPLTLEMLKEYDTFTYSSSLAEISGQASSEAILEALLKKVEDSWKGLDLIVLPYKDYNDVYILGSLEDIQLVIEEVNINLNTIITSKHVGLIKSRVMDWIKSMELITEILSEWTTCQTNWIYLESIFAAPDIQRQLPNETKMFNQVNRSWKNIMKNVSKNPMALTTCTDHKLLNIFKKNNQLLDQILLCLEAYLESKRVIFPRFYFLSNEELIEIIAQARNPRAVQPHMSKCFDAIWRIQFDNDNEIGIPTVNDNNSPTDIIAMISSERELVKFSMEVKARGNVEFWLYRVEEAMVDTLRSLMAVAIGEYDKVPRNKWVLMHSGQVK
ncbi:dynein axonemal heavy chain 6-like [Daktulosphaira vitifoliae]|uniref:dynein axonemal heavy chain 6-like n=1 Tax=Daktulosphaira vitifoliae TaxID=58002 RepID=UPI0021AA1101|nr:dynein axonemal heavy chain 6-like [Daktulosphaira vitifoliae]